MAYEALGGLVAGLLGGVAGGAQRSADIDKAERENQDKESFAQMQADLEEKKAKAIHAATIEMDRAANAEAGAAVSLEAMKGRLIDEGYSPEEAAKFASDPNWVAGWKQEESADPSLAESQLKTVQRRADAAGLLGYREQETGARDQAKTIIEQQRADALERNAAAREAQANRTATAARLPAEAQLVEYYAENLFKGDRARAAELVKQSKGKTTSEKREDFLGHVMSGGVVSFEEAKVMADNIWPQAKQADGKNTGAAYVWDPVAGKPVPKK